MNLEKIKYTPQGFSYINVDLFQVVKWGGYGICDFCGKGPFHEMKLIYILHDTYCENCFNKWLESCKTYSKEDIEEDLKIQNDFDIEWYRAHGVLEK